MKIVFVLSLFLSQQCFAQQEMGEVIGKVVDESGTPQNYVHAFFDDIFGNRYQARTDLEGRFRISNVPVGEYELSIHILGDTLSGIAVEVPRDGFFNCGDIEFEPYYELSNCPPTTPLVNIDLFGHTHVELDAEEIQQSANRFNVEQLVSGNSSEVQLIPYSNEISIRGSRADSQLRLIDGVKVRRTVQIPSASYHRIIVYTNGIPANFGDATSGVIDIETVGYFDLYREWKEMQLRAGK